MEGKEIEFGLGEILKLFLSNRLINMIRWEKKIDKIDLEEIGRKWRERWFMLWMWFWRNDIVE